MNPNSNTNNAIIIKLQGGLGNQFFQYAIGRNLSLTSGHPVKYDTSWFATQMSRKYTLNQWNTKVDLASPEEVHALKKYQKIHGKLSFLNIFFSSDDSVYIKEKDTNFDPRILTIQPPAYLDGYWQSEKYFLESESEIRSDFTFKNTLSGANQQLLNTLHSQTTVALHVRRGDYVNTRMGATVLGALDISYYQAAIRKIKEQAKNPMFVLFSDDIQWALDNIQFPSEPMITDSKTENKDIEDFQIMSKCTHHIIANSSFSWWAAWLARTPPQMVIAPKNWFRIGYSTHDLLPERWIQL